MRPYRACALAVFTLASIAAGLRASSQTASPDPSFEVATIKPVIMDAAHPFNPRHFYAHITPAGASYWSMSVAYLVAYIFRVDSYQVTGPEWALADRFDIEARFPDGANPKDDRKMLQTLLKDRFKLTFHTEKKELDGYVLEVGKRGSKLQPSAPDPVTPEADAAASDDKSGSAPAPPKVVTNPDGSSSINMGKRGTQTVRFDPETSAMHFELSKMTMQELAGRLTNCLGTGMQKVVDETGIKGQYQVAFACPNPRMPSRASSADSTPEPDASYPLTKSLDALGLKLEKRKILMDVYVLDHVEKPSAN